MERRAYVSEYGEAPYWCDKRDTKCLEIKLPVDWVYFYEHSHPRVTKYLCVETGEFCQTICPHFKSNIGNCEAVFLCMMHHNCWAADDCYQIMDLLYNYDDDKDKEEESLFQSLIQRELA